MTRYLQRTKNEHSVSAPRELAVSAVLQEGDIVETHLQFIWRGDIPCPPLSDSGHQSPAEHTLGNMRLGNVPPSFSAAVIILVDDLIDTACLILLITVRAVG